METDQSDERSEQYSDEAFLEIIRELDDPTTAEVVRELGCRGKTARERLAALEEQGLVERKSLTFARRWSIADGE